MIILVTDGCATDDFDADLRTLNASRWGAVAIRVGMAVGPDADVDALRAFAGESGVVLSAAEADGIYRSLRWIDPND